PLPPRLVRATTRASLEALQVFVAGEGVVVRSRPGPDRAADRFVAVEGALEDAFAAGQRRQLEPQLVHAGRRNVALQRAPGTPCRRYLGDRVQPGERGQQRAERFRRGFEMEVVDRLADHGAGLL